MNPEIIISDCNVQEYTSDGTFRFAINLMTVIFSDKIYANLVLIIPDYGKNEKIKVESEERW